MFQRRTIMHDMHIKKTKYTLEINFNVKKGVLEMSGSSYPEDAMGFFLPIYKWIETFISEVGKTTILNLKLNYINTSSSKCILDVLEILENYHKKGGNVQVNWSYEKDDEDALETGEEFAEDLDLNFNLIPY